MSAGQLGSPFSLIVLIRNTARLFGQLNVALQRLEFAATVRSLREHQRFHVVKMVLFHQPSTVASQIQRLACRMYDKIHRAMQSDGHSTYPKRIPQYIVRLGLTVKNLSTFIFTLIKILQCNVAIHTRQIHGFYTPRFCTKCINIS